MEIPLLDGTHRKTFRVFGLALFLAAASTPVQANWNCQDTSTGIRPSRTTQHAIGKSEYQPVEVAVPRLESLERDTQDPDDLIALYERLGRLYFRGGRFDDALRVYTAGFNLEAAATAVRENFRTALAIVLGRMSRHEEVIHLFERQDRPVCPSAGTSGRLALAFAYTAAHEYDKAEAVTAAQLADPDSLEQSKLTTFRTLHMNVGCGRKDVAACVQRWDALLRDPQRDDAATQALLERVEQLSAWPEGRAVVAAARRDNLLKDGYVDRLPQRAVELTPLARVMPAYPKQARTQGLSGSVELELEIGPDGRVQKVRVLKSSAKVFDEAALAAVREWLFKPGMAGGKPTAVVGTQVIDFRIENAD